MEHTRQFHRFYFSVQKALRDTTLAAEDGRRLARELYELIYVDYDTGEAYKPQFAKNAERCQAKIRAATGKRSIAVDWLG